MKLTQKRLRQLIREEVELMMEEVKMLDGESIPQARIITGNGIPSLRGQKLGSRGKSIIVTKGFPGTREGTYQIHVLPEPYGAYKGLKHAIPRGITGEAYYATEEDIVANSMIDTAEAGSGRDRTVTVNV